MPPDPQLDISKEEFSIMWHYGQQEEAVEKIADQLNGVIEDVRGVTVETDDRKLVVKGGQGSWTRKVKVLVREYNFECDESYSAYGSDTYDYVYEYLLTSTPIVVEEWEEEEGLTD